MPPNTFHNAGASQRPCKRSTLSSRYSVTPSTVRVRPEKNTPLLSNDNVRAVLFAILGDAESGEREGGEVGESNVYDEETALIQSSAVQSRFRIGDLFRLLESGHRSHPSPPIVLQFPIQFPDFVRPSDNAFGWIEENVSSTCTALVPYLPLFEDVSFRHGGPPIIEHKNMSILSKTLLRTSFIPYPLAIVETLLTLVFVAHIRDPPPPAPLSTVTPRVHAIMDLNVAQAFVLAALTQFKISSLSTAYITEVHEMPHLASLRHRALSAPPSPVIPDIWLPLPNPHPPCSPRLRRVKSFVDFVPFPARSNTGIDWEDAEHDCVCTLGAEDEQQQSVPDVVMDRTEVIVPFPIITASTAYFEDYNCVVYQDVPSSTLFPPDAYLYPSSPFSLQYQPFQPEPWSFPLPPYLMPFPVLGHPPLPIQLPHHMPQHMSHIASSFSQMQQLPHPLSPIFEHGQTGMNSIDPGDNQCANVTGEIKSVGGSRANGMREGHGRLTHVPSHVRFSNSTSASRSKNRRHGSPSARPPKPVFQFGSIEPASEPESRPLSEPRPEPEIPEPVPASEMITTVSVSDPEPVLAASLERQGNNGSAEAPSTPVRRRSFAQVVANSGPALPIPKSVSSQADVGTTKANAAETASISHPQEQRVMPSLPSSRSFGQLITNVIKNIEEQARFEDDPIVKDDGILLMSAQSQRTPVKRQQRQFPSTSSSSRDLVSVYPDPSASDIMSPIASPTRPSKHQQPPFAHLPSSNALSTRVGEVRRTRRDELDPRSPSAFKIPRAINLKSPSKASRSKGNVAMKLEDSGEEGIDSRTVEAKDSVSSIGHGRKKAPRFQRFPTVVRSASGVECNQDTAWAVQPRRVRGDARALMASLFPDGS